MQVVSQIGHFRLFREGARHIGCREIAKPFRNSGKLHRLAGRAKTLIGFGGQSIGRLVAQKLAGLSVAGRLSRLFGIVGNSVGS